MASAVFSSPSTIQVQLWHNGKFQFQRSTFLHTRNVRRIHHKHIRNLVKAQFQTPDASRQFHIMKERLQNYVSDTVKNFPWKKAEEVLLDKSYHVGRKYFSWSFILWFGFAFISDVMFSVSRNGELVMPLGLLAGCLLADFIKETSLEYFKHTEGKDITWHLLVSGCFCIFLRLISILFPIQGRLFLLHAADGGLMQILWQWRNLAEKPQMVD